VKTYRDHIAIEAGKPFTPVQRTLIKRVLKEYDYYSMVISIGGKYAKKDEFRPIRNI